VGTIANNLKKLLPVVSIAVFLLFWQYSSGFYSSTLLPSPLEVLAALFELIERGVLAEHITVSILRFLAGYILAVIFAVPLGIMFGYYPLFHFAVDPLIQVLRPISPIAWFPLAVLWFGIGNAPAVFIIFLASFFPLLLSTLDSVRQIPSIYFKVAANFGAGKRTVFFKVILPAAFPGIMVGLHIAVGTAWIHLVAGEMLGSQSGLGYLIVDSRNFLRTDWIIVGMLTVGIIGLVIYNIMKMFEIFIKKIWGVES